MQSSGGCGKWPGARRPATSVRINIGVALKGRGVILYGLRPGYHLPVHATLTAAQGPAKGLVAMRPARRRPKNKCPLRGAPRLPARGGAADKRAAKKGRTPWGVCNAPYARVLRARIAQFSAGFARHRLSDRLSPIVRPRLTSASYYKAKPLITFVIPRPTAADGINS